MDQLAVIQSAETIKELNLIDDRVKSLVSTFKDLVDTGNKINTGLLKGTPKEFIESEKQLIALNKQKADIIKQLSLAEANLSKITIANANARKAEANADKADIALKQKKIQLSKQEEKEQQRLIATVALYKKVEQGLNSLRARYNELAIKKEFGIELSRKEEIRMAGLEKTMLRYDKALKAVDASGGKYNRNVGNYASGFNAMNNSVAQLAREMPAFANSVQTGFMAISNNLPIFFDAINQAVDKNKQLTAEGKKGVPVWKQLGGALFSFSTLLSVGVVLLTVYGKDMVIWAQNMLKGSSAASIAAKNTKDLNEARKEGLKSSATELVQLKTMYRVATDVNLTQEQRLRAARKLVDLYPTTLGYMGAENIMLGKAAKQYQLLTKAIIASAQARGIENILTQRMEDTLLKEEYLQKQLNESIAESNKLRKGGSTTQTVSDGQGGLIRKEISNQKLLNGELYKQGVIRNGIRKIQDNAAKENEALINRQIQLQNEASQYESDKYGKDAPKVAGAKTTPLSKEQRDYLDSLAAIRDNEIAIQKERQLNGEINEKQYWEKYIVIIKNYRQKIEDYLKGANGRQRAIEASVRKRAVDEVVKANKEIYDYEKSALDAQRKLYEQNSETRLESIKRDEFILEQERIKQQNDVYNELIANTDLYYQNLIESAKRNAQEIINIELERDTAISGIQKNQITLNSGLPTATKKDIEYYRQIDDAYRSAANAEERLLILTNSRLNLREREFFLSLKTKEQTLDALEVDKRRNQEREKELRDKATTTKLTIDEGTELAKLVDSTSLLNEKIALTAEEIKRLKIDKLREDWGSTLDLISNGLNELGFSNLANEVDRVFEEIIGKTFDWKDAMLLAGAAVADGLTQLNQKTLDNRIATLDEQLKYTQSTTEQELGFINARLESLNAIENASREQIQERNALEDEARVVKEQQLQREKMIATQKAKAEQRAAANQALINGFLAATKTLANLGIPAGIIPAAVAAGFGAIQAGLIMSKNPVPQYFVGRKGGIEEIAYTQEKGRELITNNGKIKSLGSDNGAVLTHLDKGDTVHTASETQKILSNFDNIPKLGANVFHKIANQSVTPIFVQNDKIDYDKLADKIGDKFERGLRKFDKPTITENEKGEMFIHEGGKYPVYVGKRKKQSLVIKQSRNEHN